MIKIRRLLLVVAALVVAVVLIYTVVRIYGTGFDGYNKITTSRTIGRPPTITEEYQPGKSLWDWMSLLIIPAILALVGFFFTRTERKNEQAIAQQRADTDRAIAQKRADTEQELAIDSQQE